MFIKDLQRQGIQVDEDNQPAPEDNNPQNAVWYSSWDLGEAVVLSSLCKHRFVLVMQTLLLRTIPADGRIIAGILLLTTMSLPRMCFPEEFVVKVLIPTMNTELVEKFTLNEYNVWLGCIFFMLCYNSIQDQEMWWLTKPIDMFVGAPF